MKLEFTYEALKNEPNAPESKAPRTSEYIAKRQAELAKKGDAFAKAPWAARANWK